MTMADEDADGGRWTTGPFGTPDASRANVSETYIPVPGAMPDLANISGRFRERIVIGKKGAGKTIYLKALQSALGVDAARTGNEAVLNAGWIIVPEIFRLSSEEVLSVSQASQRSHAQLVKLNVFVDQAARTRDLWTRIWDCALLAATYRLVTSKTGSKAFEAARKKLAQAEELREKAAYVKDFLRDIPPSNSPVVQIKFFLAKKANKVGDVRAYVDRHEWSIVYEILEKIINLGPQIALFIDAIDEDFDEAPEAWLDCQEGLFRSIFSFLNRQDDFSNRVHAIVALREIVFSSLLTSEHASRYLWDNHVRYISWDPATARVFLSEKIAALHPDLIASPGTDPARDPVRYWLGFSHVENTKRQIVESASDYILRHTRLLPRDIVMMGNAICTQIQARARANRTFTEAKFRQTVHDVAKAIAREAIASSVNEHLTSIDYVSEVLLSARKRQNLGGPAMVDIGDDLDELGASDISVIIDQIKQSVSIRVDRFFAMIGREKFAQSELRAALVLCDLAFDDDFEKVGRAAFSRFDNILYRHGLIAYEAFDSGTSRWKFSWRGVPSVESSQMPGNEQLYAFHASVLDAYPTITVDDKDPVY